MNTTAANQADRQIELVSEDPLGNTQARWSTDDELLVWTVSRIEGGRRQGVERDCHVVYALSSGFFVEQTRKFRASAEQCIDMLQQGKRAGTIQRKIALDSIIALKSDPGSGRLQIRTLNGTHRIDPVSNDEADVLRQIGAELALRMPAGGASFADYSGPSHTERRRAQHSAESPDLAAERERHALAALENARAEDRPDGYAAPSYEVPDGALERPVSPVTDQPIANSSVSAADLQRIAAAVQAEMDPESEPAGDLPADINVAGGVDITFEPAPEYVAAEHVAAEHAAAEYIAPQDVAPQQVSTEAFPQYATETPDADPMSERLMRRQQRALRRQIEGAPEPAAVDQAGDSTPETYEVSPAPSSMDPGIDLPVGAVFHPVKDNPVQHEVVPVVDNAHLRLRPEAAPAEVELDPAAVAFDSDTEEDRRQIDDPSFPSVFDRRGAQPGHLTSRPGWAKFDDDEDDEDVPEAVDPASEPDEQVEEQANVIPEGPPTLSAPTGGQVIVSGGAVGFNPDFDVNPFR